VIDLSSLNGIYVNGETVLQAPLEPGDLLRIGGFTFMVQRSETPAEPSILQTLASEPPRAA
jgi:pSer/pThr/pTyr-binding forkhead associated (FHA) protein